MKVFIALFVAFAALVSVNCDAKSDQKEWVKKTTAAYANMTETEVKTHVNSCVRDIEVMMKEAADQYVKEDLDLVAKVYSDIVMFVQMGIKAMYTALDKQDVKSRKVNLIGLGVTVEAIKLRAGMEKQKRAKSPLKVTDTEANLQKKFDEVYDKVVKLDKDTVDVERKKKELGFWADVHEKIYEFLTANRKNLEGDIKKLKTTAIRAKNLQVMLNDLTLLLEVADTREKSSFFSRVGEKISSFAAKIKETFAKIF